MTIQIENQTISYHETGQGRVLLVLHGWGCNKEMFEFMHDHFSDRFRVISVDLPGFGQSEEPKSVWGTQDYADCIERFLQELGAEKPIVFGHSFGGRVLLALAGKMPIQKMILTGSAGLVPHRPLSYHWKVAWFKTAKWIYRHSPLKTLYPDWLEKRRQNAGSADYRQASPQMRKVLVKVINEDLAAEIAKISTPTILLWGTEDTATPLTDGQRMAALLQDGALIPLEGGSHYAILEQKNRCLTIMDAFVGGKRDE